MSPQLFSADAAGGDTATFHNLSSPETAKIIRFKPENTSVCLRVEIYAVPGINTFDTILIIKKDEKFVSFTPFTPKI